jgi:hypothetical protein
VTEQVRHPPTALHYRHTVSPHLGPCLLCPPPRGAAHRAAQAEGEADEALQGALHRSFDCRAAAKRQAILCSIRGMGDASTTQVCTCWAIHSRKRIAAAACWVGGQAAVQRKQRNACCLLAHLTPGGCSVGGGPATPAGRRCPAAGGEEESRNAGHGAGMPAGQEMGMIWQPCSIPQTDRQTDCFEIAGQE